MKSIIGILCISINYTLFYKYYKLLVCRDDLRNNNETRFEHGQTDHPEHLFTPLSGIA